MKPKPWSYSALDKFVSCPRQYYELRIAKSVVEAESEQMRWGTWVHKQFEDRQKHGITLPPEVSSHETLMLQLDALPGVHETEQQVALNRQMQPTPFDAEDVWWRGIIDYVKRTDTHATIVDYKTGKPHQKFGQLKLFALYLFARHPEIDTVRVDFYWTKTHSMTGATYTRSMTHALWNEFLPNLKQYVEAFRTDTWQTRPSGLCHGWCPVTDCDHWKPKRAR